MILHYSQIEKLWCILTGAGPRRTFASNQQHLPVRPLAGQGPVLSIPIDSPSKNAGPLIGIMTARKKNGGSIAGNGQLFAAIQKKIIGMGGISVVFTPDRLTESTIQGYLYVPGKQKWIEVSAPIPDLIYNRIPFRQAEKTAETIEAFIKFADQNIPIFNPCFLDKYVLYEILNQNEEMRPYLPATIAVHNDGELQDFLDKHHSIYLKPRVSAQGKGIFRVMKDSEGTIALESKRKKISFGSYAKFWAHLSPTVETSKYIAQEAVTPARLTGHRFDFRILAHWGENGYRPTGVGIRQSGQQELTTHLPNGGKLLPYSLVRSSEHDQFIEKIVRICGESLSSELGFFGEFSIDAGITANGEYVLYEINSKPMSFDEPEIEEQRVRNLCNLFFLRSGFPIPTQ
ncbi:MULTISPECIES: YheC/YheD family endospore coat-associated protein [Bacillus]|uniref:YheC/YheD family endospore coat-associated protein n=1 Tax=Bacillus TaxID=1386 RepID=UPI002155DED7|nr:MULTISPECIES: YheC/YheD family protein [Bacillus]